MKTRSTVRITSFLVLGLFILIASTVINTRNMNEYKLQLEASYQQSLGELSENLGAINADLTKSLYSNSSSEQQRLSRELFAKCAAAKNAASRLPVSQMELSNAYKFLSQAGDYAQYINSKLERGEKITEQEHRNIKTLLSYSEKLSKSADEMTNMTMSGARITDGEVKSGELNFVPLSNSFSQSAKAFESFPTLLYDGPFSDRVLNKKSRLVSKSKVMSRKECKKIASRALGKPESKLIFDSDERSKIPCYTFKSGRYVISVTKQGGYIKSILNSGVVDSSRISEDNAVNLAKDFLDKIGYTDMKDSYYSKADNICTINFAYAKSDVYIYSDLIKVGISLSDGKIVSLDAQTYLTNHTKRSAFKAKLTPEMAKSRVSPYLKINSIKKCVIPKEDGTEAQCYEFSCTSRDTGEDALVYINSDSGKEENILLLLYTDGGTFTE